MTNNHDNAGEDPTGKDQGTGPVHGLRGEDPRQGDLRDTQGGTYDRHDREGGRRGDQVKEKRTPPLSWAPMCEASRFRQAGTRYPKAWSTAQGR
jgi:hypothetical protein